MAPRLLNWAVMQQPERVPVAIFMTTFQPGGTERQMIELVRRLDRRRFEVHLACFHRRGPWLSRVSDCVDSLADFPIHGFASLRSAAQARAFGAWCRRQRIVVLHTADLYANIFGLMAGALARVPVRIGNRREVTAGKTPAQVAVQRMSYAAAHAVVANSAAAAARLRREGVPARKIRTIPNGIDSAAFALPRRGKGSGRPRVTVVARLRPEKGHQVLLDAAPAILARHPDVEFQFVGDGPCDAPLRAQARARGVTSQVSFLGHREDIHQCLADSTVFVLPSLSEAFPNALMEAMAAGCPVVASAVGGIPELVADGRTGLLVPPADPPRLAAAVVQLLDDRVRALALGEAARREVQARFSFDRMVSAFETLYLTELERRPAARWHAAPAAAR